MLTSSVQCLGIIVLCAYAVTCDAFWWRPSTTESPQVKQIPLGYFRTYTYQPISYPNGFGGYPYGWVQKPYSNPLLSGYKYDSPQQMALQQTAAVEVEATSSSVPPSTSTTTTTTTTTTPVPSTTTSTTPAPVQAPTAIPFAPSTTEPTVVPLVNSASNFISRYSSDYHQSPSSIQAEFYNRQYQQQANYYKPISPTGGGVPSYVLHQPMAGNQRQQVQFVPCMCPVSIGMPSSFMENRSVAEEDAGADESAIDEESAQESVPEKSNSDEEGISETTTS